jgi:endonuclease YncB( thermonuclease family)
MVVERYEASYRDLRDAVQRALAEGILRAQKAVTVERVRTYWEIGGYLQKHLDLTDSSYGDQAVKQLSFDVKISRQVLYDSLKFHCLFPKVPAKGLLTWSHYRRLLSVQDAALQDRLLAGAAEGSWSLRELDAQIQEAKSIRVATGPDPLPAKALQAKRGEPYQYRTVEKQGRLALDLGFRDSHPLPTSVADRLSLGAVVRSTPDARFAGQYRFDETGLRTRLYAYPAKVQKIIDGDTLWATLDLGFGLWADRKLRLRGIDTPEVGTAGGLRAKDYLAKTLSEAGSFVVTTTKLDLYDLYDRYLADLFVLPGETDPVVIAREGRFVNRELIAEGLARFWTDAKPPEF